MGPAQPPFSSGEEKVEKDGGCPADRGQQARRSPGPPLPPRLCSHFMGEEPRHSLCERTGQSLRPKAGGQVRSQERPPPATYSLADKRLQQEPVLRTVRGSNVEQSAVPFCIKGTGLEIQYGSLSHLWADRPARGWPPRGLLRILRPGCPRVPPRDPSLGHELGTPSQQRPSIRRGLILSPSDSMLPSVAQNLKRIGFLIPKAPQGRVENRQSPQGSVHGAEISVLRLCDCRTSTNLREFTDFSK